MYTVELYKADKRKSTGERLVKKTDHSTHSKTVIAEVYDREYPSSKGYRYEIHETMVKRVNMMGGVEFMERYDTPYFCSPSSESYWSM
jgi:hypothetical protein